MTEDFFTPRPRQLAIFLTEEETESVLESIEAALNDGFSLPASVTAAEKMYHALNFYKTLKGN